MMVAPTGQGELSVDPGPAFRESMAALAATTCVVTAAIGDERAGRTVTAVLSLAVDPPSLLVSIDANARLAAMIRSCGGFSFAMLEQGQRDVASAFAGAVARDRRFDHGRWETWPSGQPRLRGAVATMDCTVGQEIEIADHVLFVGHPLRIDLAEGSGPLVWHGRRFNAVQPV